jgi:hypothetical protein
MGKDLTAIVLSLIAPLALPRCAKADHMDRHVPAVCVPARAYGGSGPSRFCRAVLEVRVKTALFLMLSGRPCSARAISSFQGGRFGVECQLPRP